MSLTTDHHQDDLEVRRRRKEARKAAAPSTKPAPPSAAAARGLLGGLITGGSRPSRRHASYIRSERRAASGKRARVIGRHRRDRRPPCRASPGRNRGDRLRQSDGIRPRRPAGTAELPPTLRRHGAGRGGRSDPPVAPPRVAPSEDGRPRRRPGRRDWTSRDSAEQRCRSRLAEPLNISASRTTLAAAHAGDIGLDLAEPSATPPRKYAR